MGRNGKQNEAVFPTNLNLAWCELIIRQLKEVECTTFYVSPGMRNAPIIKAIQNSTDVKMIVNIDERSSSYQALGHIKGNGKPVALVCTSGTALANYFPAVVEAYYSHLPLIIISADRPPELTCFDVNQTIDQTNFFGNYSLSSINLPIPSPQVAPSVLLKMICNEQNLNGPNHINVPLDEPLGSEIISIDRDYLAKWSDAKPSTVTPLTPMEYTPVFENLDQTLLVIGSIPFAQDKENLVALINSFPGDIYLDISSSLNFFTNRSTISEFKGSYTDIIHIGNRITHKGYFEFLKDCNPQSITICNQLTHKKDHFPKISRKYQMDMDKFAKLLVDSYPPKTSFPNVASITHDSDYHKLCEELASLLPKESNLYLANSMPIRVFNEVATPKSFVNVATNRAVSGIEGLIASAIGLAEATNKQTTLLIGDISFLHDATSLSQIKELPISIIIANNRGGKIFETLPVASDHELLETITTPHNYTFSHLAKQFDLSYKLVDTVAALKNTYGDYQIIEVTLNGTME